jgi:dolichyl-phosphate-mannose--protein O-mannosyl transferase
VVRYILMVGTPTLWLLFAPALLWVLWRVAARRDPAAVVVAVSIAAGWLTWFTNLERTMFIFYMAPAVPFFVLGITLALQDVLGRPGAPPLRRQIGLGVVALYVAVVAGTFVFFYPVLAGLELPVPDWSLRIWFPSWN